MSESKAKSLKGGRLYHIIYSRPYHSPIDGAVSYQDSIIKSYPCYEQCITWLLLKGKVYETGKGDKWINPRYRIAKDVQ